MTIFCGPNVVFLQHFNNQLTHTTLKNVELLKYFKISKTAPTCFGLHMPHRSQYAAITLKTSCTASTYLLLTKCVIFSYVLIVAPW